MRRISRMRRINGTLRRCGAGAQAQWPGGVNSGAQGDGTAEAEPQGDGTAEAEGSNPASTHCGLARVASTDRPWTLDEWQKFFASAPQ